MSSVWQQLHRYNFSGVQTFICTPRCLTKTHTLVVHFGESIFAHSSNTHSDTLFTTLTKSAYCYLRASQYQCERHTFYRFTLEIALTASLTSTSGKTSAPSIHNIHASLLSLCTLTYHILYIISSSLPLARETSQLPRLHMHIFMVIFKIHIRVENLHMSWQRGPK